MNTESKKKKRRAEEERIRRQNEVICVNCGKPGTHFCPPSFGESGFFACDAFEKEGKETPS